MRIKSGGPTQTQQTQQATKTSTTSKAGAAKFAGMIGNAGSATDRGDAESQGKGAMMAALAELAADIEAGKTTKEEASRRFVGLVIEERFGKQNGKGAETMQSAVGDMVESDPQFASKLQSQLKRIKP
jgi:hypothetical protein